MVRSFQNCDRSASTAERIPSNTSSGKPPGLAAVFSISGGTAAINTALATRDVPWRPDRKSTRLNSSHLVISYAVFCLKKKKKIKKIEAIKKKTKKKK